ncbi:winged helix DNA-binding domain-containing protein [Streptomyces sp. G1]|uniref:winged helix DNA-binding domain-containing protein n=1 Tax=Streptomyces sp. G1 TaxID=361572 RepID=UPI00202DE918|nr:winged helix DNA-binding domain-containing protein [Streptomyces sp. G1]MCM1973640.1 winged helix DNA-binding domain-containing protein [Streptomyces sp. G1]
MTVTISWEAASARRLERQFLANPATGAAAVPTVVASMLGAHAQVLSAAELSIGVRITGATRTDVRAALWEHRTLVKTHGPRGTVHLLPTRDLPLWTSALPAIPSGAGPFAPEVRVTEQQAQQIVTAIEDALDGACLTIDELSDKVVARTGPWAGDRVMPAFQGMWPRWRQVLHRAGQSGALCFGPDRGRKVTYTRSPRFDPLPATEAVPALLLRYLHAYGPATPAYFAKWLAAPTAWAARLFEEQAASGAIEEVAFEGASAWVAAGDTEFPSRGWRGVRLLPYFDAYGIAAQPRESLFPGEAYGRALARGQAGNYPVLLVDGAVAGVWHLRRQGKRAVVTVEVLGSSSGALKARQEEALAEQVDRLGEVLEARPELVRGEVRVGPHA